MTSGLAFVAAGELYGYIDGQGHQRIPPCFEDAHAFSEGLEAVKLGGKCRSIKPDGASAIAAEFDCFRQMARPFRDGLARIVENRKWGYINRDAEIVISALFGGALEFSESLGLIKLEKSMAMIDTTRTMVVPPSFVHARGYPVEFVAVHTRAGEAHGSGDSAREPGFIHSSEALVLPTQFLTTGRFQDGLCLVETEKNIGYIHPSGAFLLRSKRVEVGSFDLLHLLPPENALKS